MAGRGVAGRGVAGRPAPSPLTRPLSLPPPQLKCASDAFSVVADHFGRGVFNKLTLVTDPPPARDAANAALLPQRPA